jgi:formylglycine-generating enzyme required for sulfatase activity
MMKNFLLAFAGFLILSSCTNPFMERLFQSDEGTNVQELPVTVSYTVTITVEQMTDPSFDEIDGGTIFRNGNPTSISFAYMDTGSYTCEWTIDGVGAYAGLITLSKNSSCTVYATDTKYNSLGKHAVYLTVVKDGVPYKKTIWVTIVEDSIAATGVTLDKTSLSLVVGGPVETLTPLFTPPDATNKNVTWSISPSGIATVSNGTVTALAAGTAIITATSVSDTSKTASCTVTVNPKPVTITGLTAANKFYDGTTTATITGTATINGLIGGDSVNVSDGTAVFENATVGYNKTVTFSGFSLTGADVGNYTLLSQPTNVTASIVEKPVMVQITAGTFQMGSPENELGRTEYEIQHSVTLANSFYMGKYQVTQVQYQVVMGSNPSNFYWNPATGEIQGYRPVERVSWYDALVFCNKLSVMEGLTPAYSIDGSTDPAAWGTVPTSSDATWNTVSIVAGSTGYRLPTEAQWEYACRAGTTTAYNLGDTWNDDWGWIVTNSNDMTHEVGKKLPNTWGLYDMHGNTRDWCWDWHSPFYYTNSPTNDPQGASSGANRVLRGGYYPLPAQYSRSASRDGAPPSQRSVNIGFRLIRP